MDNKFKQMKLYRDKINELIKEKPSLRDFQAYIDSELKKAGNNTHNRLAVMENIILEHRVKMIKKLKSLKGKL